VDAATRAARLQAVEQVTTNLAHQEVTALEGTLQPLDASVQQNAAVLQHNMRTLEDRMKAMSSS
jgi:hypothetical protein